MLVVDDIQHVDRDSLDVLDFVMRRVTARGVPVVPAARGRTPPHGVPTDLPTVHLGVELRASGAPSGPAQVGPLTELTAQQREIVRLAAQGLRNKEIAERLRLSPRTVSSHHYLVYPKLGVSSRNQLRGLFEDA